MADWFRQAKDFFSDMPQHATANSDERNPTAVTAVPHPGISPEKNIEELDPLIDRLAEHYKWTADEIAEGRAAGGGDMDHALSCLRLLVLEIPPGRARQ